MAFRKAKKKQATKRVPSCTEPDCLISLKTDKRQGFSVLPRCHGFGVAGHACVRSLNLDLQFSRKPRNRSRAVGPVQTQKTGFGCERSADRESLRTHPEVVGVKPIQIDLRIFFFTTMNSRMRSRTVRNHFLTCCSVHTG